jgi:hypothetical protein
MQLLFLLLLLLHDHEDNSTLTDQRTTEKKHVQQKINIGGGTKMSEVKQQKNTTKHGNLSFTRHFPSRLHESAAQGANLWAGLSVVGHGSRRGYCRRSSGAQLARSNTKKRKRNARVLEEKDQVGFCRLLQCQQSVASPAHASSHKQRRRFSANVMKGLFSQQKLRGPLVPPDLAKCYCARSETVRFGDSGRGTSTDRGFPRSFPSRCSHPVRSKWFSRHCFTTEENNKTN